MVDRRKTLSWLLRALALGASPAVHIDLAQAQSAQRHKGPLGNRDASPAAPGDHGYGRDPNLLHPHVTWPLTLSAQQKGAVARLADVFLPQIGTSPAASTVGVPDFLDEWISAPYPQQQADRQVILDGLAAMERDAPGPVNGLATAQVEALVARLQSRAVAGQGAAAQFFSRFRNICLVGYYTTLTGVAELGYVGYQPSATFAGPPPEVLARLGV